MSNKVHSKFQDEKDLVSRLKQGQEAAYRILIRSYQGQLFSIAYGITMDREESLDIVQEVFLKVHQNIKNFRGDSGLSTWLHRITVNQSLNLQRKWKRRLKWRHQPLEKEEGGDYPELGDNQENPETLYHKGELEKALQEGLNELPETSRTVFVLREIEGLSYDEIAEVLNIKKGTVKSRLFLARQKLKERLSEYLNETEEKP
ncbi:MAG: sigma-70 family RNA polymerase sigma factor [Candidatus Adiutricales bacterium]